MRVLIVDSVPTDPYHFRKSQYFSDLHESGDFVLEVKFHPLYTDNDAYDKS